LNDWSNGNEKGRIDILYQGGTEEERIAKLVVDPKEPTNQVLHFDIKSPNVYDGNKATRSRTQMQFHNTSCLKECYQTVRLYFPEEMSQLKEYLEEIYWLPVFEFWNNANWTDEKNPFRVTVEVVKEAGAENNLHFSAEGQIDETIGAFENVWVEENTDFTIPFDQWMEVELYILEGDQNNDRFYMAVTPEEEEEKQVLFDVTNATQHPKEKCPDGFTHLQPLKWYTSDKLANYMKDQGKSLEIYWDDWSVWRNKRS